jgi:ribosomal protein S18 acetylase RimI-like enzyme
MTDPIDLPAKLFTDPVWNALHTRQAHFAIGSGDACRYPADVAPFASVAAPTTAALQQLASLLTPGESVWIFGEQFPAIPELEFVQTIKCLQMVLPNEVIPPEPAPGILPLSAANAPEMVALTDLAFRGFFRARTCDMGTYYGIRHDDELVAMCGERMVLDGYPEISGLCTNPAYRGKGYAADLIWQLVRNHRSHGDTSWLHVTSTNSNAIALYHRLGFITAREVTLQRVCLAS